MLWEVWGRSTKKTESAPNVVVTRKENQDIQKKVDKRNDGDLR